MLLVLASLLLAVAAESPPTQQGYGNDQYGSEYSGGSASSKGDKGTLENLGLLDSEVADQLNGKGWQDVVPGTAEKDYPNLDKVPETSFTCEGKIAGGYYADVETRCQVFHVCNTGGVKSSFLCPGGSIFNQKYFVCDWWYDFECDDAIELYYLNAGNNHGNEGSDSKSDYPENDYSSNNGDQNPSISYNGRSNILKDRSDLSLAGTGEGGPGYTRNRESHGYQSNVNNIRRNENRPSGNYNDRKNPGQQRISNDSGENAGRFEERSKNHDKANENRETHENYSVPRDNDRSIHYSARKDESLNGYEQSLSTQRIFSSQDNRNSRFNGFNDRADRDHFDLDKNEAGRNFEKGKYLPPRNEQSSFNERSKGGERNFDKAYDKNNYYDTNNGDSKNKDDNNNRFSNIQGINNFHNTVRNHDHYDHFVNEPRSQGQNGPSNEPGRIPFESEESGKSYQQNNHYPTPAHRNNETSDRQNVIENNQNHFGERSSSKPGITYLHPNRNEDEYQTNDSRKNNDSETNVNQSSKSLRDYRKRQCDDNRRQGESSNNIPPEFRQDQSKPLFAPDNSRQKNAGRTVQRTTAGLQGGIGNGYPGPNRELPGSNAIAGTVAPVLPVGSQDAPNDRVRGIGSLNFNGNYPSNEYPSGPPRQETGSPEFGLNANNGYPSIRPNPNTNGILTGQGRTSLATKTPSGTTSPGEITSISTGYSNGGVTASDNFNEHNTRDYKGGLRRDENHFSTSHVPPFGKRNRIKPNQGYLPPESANNGNGNERFVKNDQNDFGKFEGRNGHEKGSENIDYLPPKSPGNERDGRHMQDRRRYLPAL